MYQNDKTLLAPVHPYAKIVGEYGDVYEGLEQLGPALKNLEVDESAKPVQLIEIP